MFVNKLSLRQLNNGSRLFSTLPKTCVVGAAGGIGQPLSLLLKISPNIGELNLYDVVNTPGVAADLSHINTAGSVKGFVGADQMAAALKGMEAVVIPAGVPRKPGMTRDDLFNTNASIVASIAKACAEHCPDANFFIISNPVNSTVPIFAEIFKKTNPGKFAAASKKIYGVTTLDVTRANTFCGEVLGKSPADMNVTVIGGHAGTTILPLLSKLNLPKDKIDFLTNRIQFGGDEVVKAKAGTGSATLSMAYAAKVFVEKVMKVWANEKSEVVECAFVKSDVYEKKHGCEYFASPVRIGKKGVDEILEPEMNDYEKKIFDSMIGDLKKQVQKGKEFAANYKA